METHFTPHLMIQFFFLFYSDWFLYSVNYRCFDTKQLSMKFERGMDHEVVAFHILSDDWKKIVLLQSNRYIEFQTQDGIYYKTRIPTFGRDMCYYNRAAELFIG